MGSFLSKALLAPFRSREEPTVAVEEAEAADMYNMMQDVRAMFLIVDLRAEAAFEASHLDSAVGVAQNWGKVAPEALVQKRFEDVNLQSADGLPFSLCCCCDGGDGEEEEGGRAAAERALQWFWRARAKFNRLELSRALFFSFTAFREKFPFACTDFMSFEASRVFPSYVADRLFLSHWSLAADSFVVRTALQATHVVNCSANLPCSFEGEGVTYFRVPVHDEQGADLQAHLEGAVAFLEEALASGGTVLVHCKHGQSRSASVVAAFLMKTRSWDLQRTLNHLRRCRPRVKPNPGFQRQLDAFQCLLAERR